MSFKFENDYLSGLKYFAENSAEFIYFILDNNFRMIHISPKFSEITGINAVITDLNDILTADCVHFLEKIKHGYEATLDFKGLNDSEFSIKCTFLSAGSGYIVFCSRYIFSGDSILNSMTKLNNELSSALKELDRKNKELEDARNKIKVLSGLLPVCSYCKKIRNEDESWSQLESYIDKHSEAEFSHTICPACMDKYFPE